MIVCLCNAVTDRDLRRAVDAGAASFEEVQRACGVATGCGRCRECAVALVDDALRCTLAGAVAGAG